jgi:hypothetical protein
MRHLNGLSAAFGNVFSVARLRIGYWWSFSFHATPMLSLCQILYAFGPATTAYGQHDLRHFGVDQQYPIVFADTSQLLVE